MGGYVQGGAQGVLPEVGGGPRAVGGGAGPSEVDSDSEPRARRRVQRSRHRDAQLTLAGEASARLWWGGGSRTRVEPGC